MGKQTTNIWVKSSIVKKPSSYITYLDANNFYGWTMSHKLPTRGFKWMTKTELESWKRLPCILEVDLEYPVKFHD